MSQKVAESSSSGSWGTPIRIKGIKGDTGPQGVPGTPGKDGKVYYTWIKYADDVNGAGISNDPTGKTFIGLAYNKETATESNTASDYTWSRFRGEDGTDGVPGPAGEDGKTTYTWIAYSDNADGSDLYQIPTDSTKYIGIAVNKDTATESSNPTDYTWSRFRGADGQDAVMFAIEFYMNGISVQNIPCDIHSNSIGGNILTANLYRISGDTKILFSANKWIVTYLKNGSEVISWNVPEVPTASVDISLDRSFEYDSILVQPYRVIGNETIASGTISKVMANVPNWLVGWDTNKVQIGSEYMISPKLFTGKNTGTAEEPILTGIVQGDKCITIDGVERSGIYALVENEVVFELDPENGKYKFNGEVNATSGVFKNIKSPNESFKINEAGEIEIVGKVSTSSNGTRIEIDPATNSLKMYTKDDMEVGVLSFFETEWNGVINYLPRLRLRRYVDNVLYNETSIDSGTIFCSQKLGSDDYSCYLIPSNGLTFYKNNEQTKHYSKS